MTAYEPLHHKYRPQTFAQLVGQEAIATTLTNAIMQEKIAPAYLFTGPRGTGKTSSARIFAKSLNCLQYDRPTPEPCGNCDVCRAIARGSALDVIEIDAASNTGVDNIRELIEKAQFAPVQCRYKVYVIDECHMLSVSAFNALLKTLEEPPNHVIFVLATTDPQRVLPTIISRCQRFDYRRIPLDSMVVHLQAIATKENININPEALTLVAQIANGGLRDAESLLDQLSLLSGVVTPERVWDLVGVVAEPDLLALLNAIRSDNPEAVISQGRNLMNRGREPLVILQNLANFYLNLLLAKNAPDRSDLVAVTAPTWAALCQEATNWKLTDILQGQKHLKDSEVQIKNTTQPRLWLEITLLGLLPSALPQPQVVTVSSTNPAPPVREQPPISQGNNVVPRATNTVHHIANITRENPTIKPDVSVSHADNPVEENTISEPLTADSSNPEIWEQVLSHITQFSTQTLLRQQGGLISFQNNVAHVGLKNQSLVAIAQKNHSYIEAAFQSVFQRKITVKLEVATINKSASANVNSAPPPPKPDLSVAPIREEQIPEVAKKKPLPDPNESVGVKIKAPEKRVTIPNTQVNIEEQKIDNARSNLPPSLEEVFKAAETIAKVFEGEIIALDDLENDIELDTEEEINNNQEPLLKGRPDLSIIDEEDVPF